MIEVLSSIWALKWYEIAVVAMVDDIFVFVRIMIPIIIICVILSAIAAMINVIK